MAIPDAGRPLTPPDARMELSHLDPFTLADSGDYPPLVVVNEVRTLKSHCAWQKGDHAGNPPVAHPRIVDPAVMAPSVAGELRGRTVCGCLAWHEVPIECS